MVSFSFFLPFFVSFIINLYSSSEVEESPRRRGNVRDRQEARGDGMAEKCKEEHSRYMYR